MSKYHNRKITTSFGEFDSRIERDRFLFLLNAQKEGKISGLRRQVEYLLIPVQKEQILVHLKTKDKLVERVVEHKCSYVADFVYEKDGALVVEDTKGGGMSRGHFSTQTPDFRIKKKLMLFRHGIKVRIVTRATEDI